MHNHNVSMEWMAHPPRAPTMSLARSGFVTAPCGASSEGHPVAGSLTQTEERITGTIINHK
jgi:hypothetical protein